MKPRTWRPFLTFVQKSDPVKWAVLEAKFSREQVESAAAAGLIEIEGAWALLTDYGAEVLRACEMKAVRRARVEDALELLEEARTLIRTLDKGGRHREYSGRLTKFLVEMRG